MFFESRAISSWANMKACWDFDVVRDDSHRTYLVFDVDLGRDEPQRHTYLVRDVDLGRDEPQRRTYLVFDVDLGRGDPPRRTYLVLDVDLDRSDPPRRTYLVLDIDVGAEVDKKPHDVHVVVDDTVDDGVMKGCASVL